MNIFDNFKVVGNGIDIVETGRIRKAVEQGKESFLKRIFTENELKYANSHKYIYERLAARFAAKEAVLKAFDSGRAKFMRLKDVEIFNDENGKPYVEVHGETKKLKDKDNIDKILISMSHTKKYAVANAILIKK